MIDVDSGSVMPAVSSDQHRDLRQGPDGGQLSAGVLVLDEAALELEIELVERPQCLLGERGGRVLVEDEGHGRSPFGRYVIGPDLAAKLIAETG